MGGVIGSAVLGVLDGRLPVSSVNTGDPESPLELYSEKWLPVLASAATRADPDMRFNIKSSPDRLGDILLPRDADRRSLCGRSSAYGLLIEEDTGVPKLWLFTK